jgi:hypothetical protein
MNYYKILNEEETHRGVKYKCGLNIDPKEFIPYGDCEPGGIYFSREDILAFLHYGPWIRKVTIPKNAQVYTNPGTPRKWKADRVILGPKTHITINIIKKLIEEGANVNADNAFILKIFAEEGKLSAVKMLLDFGINPKLNPTAFVRAAELGYYDIVKLLLQNGANPNSSGGLALKKAAANCHLKITKLLIPLTTITPEIIEYINRHCKNQRVLTILNNLLYSHKKG